MEACCGAHHMGRALVAQGHAVRLMSPEYVRLTSFGLTPTAAARFIVLNMA
jgi:transposase